MLVESNGWYEIREEFMEAHSKTKLMFRMTEQGLYVLSRLHDEHEVQRPWMLPMICEPMDYHYLEPQETPALPGEANC